MNNESLQVGVDLGGWVSQYNAFNFERFIDFHMDQDYLRDALQPANDFIQNIGKPLYCGEFGVIDHAPLQTRINWTSDFISLLNEQQISRAIWSYKEMNFALVDSESKVVSEELVKVAALR